MPLKFNGLDAMRDKLKEIATKTPDRIKKALYQEAQIEMTEAKRRTPVDTGTLRASGTVHEPTQEGDRISVLLSFGGAASGYAIYVHENLTAFHKTGSAKFLESVLNESRPYIAQRIAARMKDNGFS